MTIRFKVLLSTLPLVIWVICAVWFEVHWRAVEDAGTGYGFGGVLVYRFGPAAAWIVSATVGSLCYYVGRAKPQKTIHPRKLIR